jgi:hypothetical protein
VLNSSKLGNTGLYECSMAVDKNEINEITWYASIGAVGVLSTPLVPIECWRPLGNSEGICNAAEGWKQQGNDGPDSKIHIHFRET